MKISGRKGIGYLSHNNRNFIPKNVDYTRTHRNHIYKQQSLEKAYDTCFKESFETYNNSVRKDRRYDGSYLEKIRHSKSKNPPREYYEWIIQVGDKNSCGYTTANYVIAEKILHEYMKGFIERNPQLYVFNCVMHRDESTPHIHVNFIPIAYFEKGQKIRNSLDKALEQMGHGKSNNRKDTNTMRWQKQEREILRQISRSYGLNIDDEQRNSNKHLDNSEYKILANTLEQKRIEINALNSIHNNSLLDLVKIFRKNPYIINTINRALNIILGNETIPMEKSHSSFIDRNR